MTRAAHSLHICWVGKISPWLDDRQLKINTQPFLSGWRSPKSTSIEEYAEKNNLDPDWCVERLATGDKLYLLQDGWIDETFLDIFLRSRKSVQRTPGEIFRLDEFSPDEEYELRQRLGDLEINEDLSGLVLMEVSYGLMGNHLRYFDLTSPDDAELTLGDRTIPLIRLYRATLEHGIDLPAGRWTTRRRVLDTIDQKHQAAGQRFLQSLIDYGVVEEKRLIVGSQETQRGSTQIERIQIRIQQAQILSLMGINLGIIPEDWDEDLITQLPEPILEGLLDE